MKSTAALWIACLALVACSCDLGRSHRPGVAPDCVGTRYPPRDNGSLGITEGVWGDVWFWQGDFMPVCPTGTVKPVVREVLFYELTGLDSVVWAGRGQPFFREVKSKLVGTARSNSQGFFELPLAPGTYSVFVREDTLLYSNRFDGQGHIFPVLVKQGEATGILFDITYAATY